MAEPPRASKGAASVSSGPGSACDAGGEFGSVATMPSRQMVMDRACDREIPGSAALGILPFYNEGHAEDLPFGFEFHLFAGVAECAVGPLLGLTDARTGTGNVVAIAAFSMYFESSDLDRQSEASVCRVAAQLAN